MYNVSLVKYLLQPANSSNPSIDPISSLVPGGTRYTELICTIVFVRPRRFAWVTSRYTSWYRLDFKLSSGDRTPFTQPRFPRIYFDYIWYVTLHNCLKTAAKSSKVPIFILLLCVAPIDRHRDRQADRHKNDLFFIQIHFMKA